MRKKFSVALVALMALTLFACGKKTDTKPTDTKPSSTDDTTKEVIKQYDVSVVSKIINMPDADVTKAGTITGTGKVEEGKSTTLTATPNTGFTFLGFFANETDTTPLNGAGTYTYTVSNVKAAQTFYAKWQANSYTLTVLNSDDTRGTITYEEKESYLTGEVITLTAEPETGSQFNGWWLGDTECISTDEVFEYSMYGANTTITGRFGIKQCTIEIEANIAEAMKSNYIYSDELGVDYMNTVTLNYDDDVEIGAVANDGYTFVGFYQLDENGDYDPEALIENEYTFNAEDSVKFLAYFTVNKYTLTVVQNIEDGGEITIEPENDEYEFLSKVTLTTTIADGFTFDGWYSSNSYSDETLLSDEASFEYTLENAFNTTIYAKYTPDGVQFNFEVVGSEVAAGETVYWGSVNESGLYDFDTTILLEANSTDGHEFAGWYLVTIDEETQEEIETLISSNRKFEYFIDTLATRNIRAKFVCGEYAFCGHVNIDEVDEGEDFAEAYSAIIAQTDETPYTYDSEVTLTAPTVAGYTFVGWYIGTEGYISEDLDDITFVSTDATWTFTFIYYDCPCLTACYKRNEYTIRYVTDGSTGGQNGKKVSYGLNYELVVPTLTGKNFGGWYYVDDDLESVFLTDYTGASIAPYHILGNIQVQAQWLTAQAIVSFNTDGGSTINSQTVDYNSKATRPATDPSKDGYTFVDWYDSEGNVWSFTANLITENTTIYAHWTINQYEITIESANDDAVTVNSGDINGIYDYNTLLKITANVKEGYTFAGWYEGTKLVSNSANYDYVLPSRDVTLVAKYTVNKYTVTVTVGRNVSGIDISNVTVTGAGTYDYNSTITITTTFADDYHYVAGYRTDITGTSKIILDGSVVVKDNPLTLTVPARDFFVIVYIDSTTFNLAVSKSTNTGSEGTNPDFDVYGTHYSSTTVRADREVTLHATEIDGYTFNGWYDGTTLIANTLEYKFNMPNKVLNYVAKYTEKSYTLTLYKVQDDHIEDTDDTSLIGTRSVAYKSTTTLSVNNITGYTFLGFYYAGTDTKIGDNAYVFTMPKQNVSVEARYEINAYEIYVSTYISNTEWNNACGTWSYDDDSTNSLDYNVKVTYTVAANEGWTFIGYYGVDGYVDFDSDDFNNDAYTLICEDTTFEFTVPAKDYTIFPMFEAKSYNIVYLPNGGTVAKPGKAVLMGAEFVLDVPEFTGKDFIGWQYTDMDTLDTYYLTDEEGNSNDYYSIPKNIQVMAIWGTHLQSVTFNTGYDASTYDENDTKTFVQKVEYNTAASKPTDPIRKGYTFDGWFTAADDSGVEWNFTTGLITADKVLYAHWTIKTYTVSMYNVNGNTGYFTYSVSGTTISGTVAANITSSSAVSITVEYGAVINLASTFHIGRKISMWGYRKVGGSNSQFASTNDATFTCKQDSDIVIVLYSTYIDSMKYFTFNSTMTTCTITGVSSTYASSSSLIVPEIVTSINAAAFATCTSLTTLTVPFTGISKTAIGANKTMAVLFGTTSRTGTTLRDTYYWSSNSLTSGTARYIPTSLNTIIVTDETSIYPCAFAGMYLSYVEINEGVTSIGQYAFYYCLLNTNTITIPSTVTTLNDYAFCHCSNATIKVTIPNTVTSIGKGAFADTALEVLNTPFIGKALNSTGEEALVSWLFVDSERWFKEVEQRYSDSGISTYKVGTYLKEVNLTLADSRPKYGAFMNCTSLVTFTMLAQNYNTGSAVVQPHVFNGCTKLATVTNIFYNVYDIGAYAFANCTALNIDVDVTTYSNYCYIKDYAFSNSGIKSIVIERGNQTNESVRVYYAAFYNCTSLESFTITAKESKYLGIYGSYAFNNCRSLATIEVTGFGYDGSSELTSTFEGCVNLTSAKLGKITYIGDRMFYNCTSLTTLEFTMNTASTYSFYKSIGIKAFYGTKLTALDLRGVTSIDANALENMPQLAELKVPFIGKNVSASSTSISSNYTLGYFFGTTEHSGHTSTTMHTSSSATSSYYIPSGLKQIVVWVESNNTIIGARACENVGSLKIIQFESNNTSNYYYIGDYAFYGTKIGNGQGIDSNKFCGGLRSVGDYAFYNLWVRNFILPDSVNYIGSYAFANNVLNSTKTEVSLPDNASLQIMDYAFYSNAITVLTINKFSRISENAFGSNANLVKIEFKCGTSCGTVYAKAFLNCVNTNLVCTADVTTTVFNGFISNGKLLTNWNLLKAATASTGAIKIATVQCTDGTYTVQ